MIAEVVERSVRTSGMGEAIPFSIDDSDFGFISGILSDKLYSDKQLAIIREYLVNGIDAQIENGSKRKILITAPSRFDCVFKIRDFGAGLSRSDIENTYIKFGKSTKRDSNKTEGTFGIGAKSGFSYSDSFNITSWHKGICSCYTAQKMGDGRLSLIPVSESASDEESGLEISIAIEEQDIVSFNSKLANFCKYLSVKPEFTSDFVIPELHYVCNFEDFFIEEGSYGKNKVLMGNIVYDIDVSHLMPQFRSVSNVVIKCKVGEVNVSPDREKLEYTPATKDMLNNKFTAILDTIKADTQKNIEKCSYPWEAIDMIQNLNSSFGHGVKIHPSDFVFKGRKFENSDVLVDIYTKNYKGKFERSEDCKVSIHNATAKTILVLADKGTGILPQRLAQGIQDKFGIEVERFIVSKDSDVYTKLFCDSWKPEQIVADFKPLWAKVVRGVGVIQRSTKVKLVDHRHHYRYDSKIVHLIDVSDNKVYVCTEHNHCGIKDANDIPYVEAARSLRIIYYQINHTKVKQLDSTWTPLKDAVEAAIKNVVAGFNCREYLIKKAHDEINNVEDLETFCENNKAAILKYDGQDILDIVGKFKKISGTANLGRMNAIIAIAEKAGTKITISEPQDFKDDLAKVKAFRTKYDLPVRIYDSCGWQVESFKAPINDYIKLLNEKI